MNIRYVRSSSINTYNDCQIKYFYEYILGLPSPAGKKALLGTIIHHVLELLARARQTGHYLLNDKYIDTNYLLDICWERYKIENPDKKLYPRDKKFCKESVEKILNSSFNPLNLNIKATEYQFKIPIQRPEFKVDYYDLLKQEHVNGYFELRGTVDLITEEDPDTLHIIDYKTGKRKCWTTGVMKDFEYLSEKDLQLRLYDLATYLSFPEYKNRMLTIIFINDGGPFTVSFDDYSRGQTYDLLHKHLKNVKANHLPSRLKEVKPDEKWKCDRVCHFGKTTAKDGHCVCDSLSNYILKFGTDKTIDAVRKRNEEKKVEQDISTSNRRNVYK